MVAELPHTTWGGCSAARCLPGLGLPHSSSTQAQQQPWMRPVGCKQSSQPCSDVSPSAQSHLCRPMSAKPSLVPEALCCSVSLQSSIRHRTPPIHTTWSSKQRQRCQLRPHGLCPTPVPSQRLQGITLRNTRKPITFSTHLWLLRAPQACDPPFLFCPPGAALEEENRAGGTTTTTKRFSQRC